LRPTSAQTGAGDRIHHPGRYRNDNARWAFDLEEMTGRSFFYPPYADFLPEIRVPTIMNLSLFTDMGRIRTGNGPGKKPGCSSGLTVAQLRRQTTQYLTATCELNDVRRSLAWLTDALTRIATYTLPEPSQRILVAMEREKLREQIDTAQAGLICQQRKPELTGVWLPILNGLIPQVNVKCLRFTAEAYDKPTFHRCEWENLAILAV